jgi:hypothetical protein
VQIYRGSLIVIYPLYFGKVKILVDVEILSEHVQVIRCDFKPGSVERSGDVEKG